MLGAKVLSGVLLEAAESDQGATEISDGVRDGVRIRCVLKLTYGGMDPLDGDASRFLGGQLGCVVHLVTS